uniref:NapG oxidoreductase n=1 Tax=Streptomyces collinus TaxID=42684 RepID=Q9X653_STRCU|nr:NapG oxidoreductase [Streptomyces collinus]
MSVRAAVVGLGWAGRELWLPRLRAHPDFDLVAVVDPDPAARADAVAATGVPAHAATDALDPRAVDLAVVAVPNHLHTTVAAGLLDRGVSVFLEKPVCLSGTEADTLAAAERAGGLLLAGSAARHRADVLELAAVLPEVGKVRHVDLAWVRARGRAAGSPGAARPAAAPWSTSAGTSWTPRPPCSARPRSTRPSAPSRTTSSTPASGPRLPAPRGAASPSPSAPVGPRTRRRTCPWSGSRAAPAPPNCAAPSASAPTGSPSPSSPSPGRAPPAGCPSPAEPVGAEYGRQLDGVPALLADPAGRGRAIAEARTTVRLMERLYASARAGRDGPSEPAYQQTTSR